MGKKVKIGLIVFLLCSGLANAQIYDSPRGRDTIQYIIDGQKVPADENSAGFIHKGILRAAGTFAFGMMPESNISNTYLTGNLEYYTDNKISVRGDLYYFINSTTQSSPLKKNDALYYGAFYHFPTHSHFDPTLGLEPGISYTQMLANGALDVATICPLASAIVGFNFFGEKWFHIQVDVRYAIGEHLTAADESNISELSFNFGLGFNLNVLPKHTRTITDVPAF